MDFRLKHLRNSMQWIKLNNSLNDNRCVPNMAGLSAVTTAMTRMCYYCDVIMGAVASRINSLTIVYQWFNADQKKHQSSASLSFVRGTHWPPVNSRTNGQQRGKCLSAFDDVIISLCIWFSSYHTKRFRRNRSFVSEIHLCTVDSPFLWLTKL